MVSLSKWVRARKEEKAAERRAQVAKDIKEATNSLEDLASYATALVTYGPEIKNGQQFFDFMFEDETFAKVYKSVLSSKEVVA